MSVNNTVEYCFDSEALAYRFLNTVKHKTYPALRVKFGRDDRHVWVSYKMQADVFDNTLAELDDLARELGGTEI